MQRYHFLLKEQAFKSFFSFKMLIFAAIVFRILQTRRLWQRKSRHPQFRNPEYIATRRASLRRVHRQVIYLNDKEMAALKEYCDRFGIKERSSIFREATMERILAQLDNSHPTLF